MVPRLLLHVMLRTNSLLRFEDRLGHFLETEKNIAIADTIPPVPTA